MGEFKWGLLYTFQQTVGVNFNYTSQSCISDVLCVCVFFFSAHSPDNLFLGFAVPKRTQMTEMEKPQNRSNALIYGKFLHFWKV